MEQSNKEFYYLDGSEQKGPLRIDQLILLGLKPDTLVWTEGMEDWKPAKEIEDLEIPMKKTPPPVPPTPSASKQSSTEKAYSATSLKIKARTGWLIGIIIAVILIATLPFHYSWDYEMIFPKTHLTFSNTFITYEDVDKILERYNNASFGERMAISQEPFMRKLMEKGIIRQENSNTSSGSSDQRQSGTTSTSSSANQQGQVTLTIVNNTGYEVIGVRFAFAHIDDGSNKIDRLRRDEVLSSGSSRSWVVTSGIYNIAVMDLDGDLYLKSEVSVNRDTTVTFRGSDIVDD